jgi:hypothetical protein
MTRVVLRQPTLADEDEFTTQMKASRRLRRSWIAMPTTHDAFVAYVERNARDAVELFFACRREDGARCRSEPRSVKSRLASHACAQSHPRRGPGTDGSAAVAVSAPAPGRCPPASRSGRGPR